MLKLIVNCGKQYVSSRDLYEGLKLAPSQYARWLKTHVFDSESTYKDYTTSLSTERNTGRGKFAKDYKIYL
jgi:phage anti-repressor protein